MAIFNANKNVTFNPQEINILNSGTSISGNVTSEGDLRVDGSVEGNIHVKTKLVLGPSSAVKGNIIAQNCDISGTVNGNITVSELLVIKATAKINGDIQSSKLVIEAGATFNGKSAMQPVGSNQTNKFQKPIETKPPVLGTETQKEKATA